MEELTAEVVGLLVLAFDHGYSLADIANASAAADGGPVRKRHDIDYRITQALRRIADKLAEAFDTAQLGCDRKEIVKLLKVLLRENGVRPYLDGSTAQSALSRAEVGDSLARFAH